ncbi:Phosphatidylinositol glycan, class a [Globisporangium polare]
MAHAAATDVNLEVLSSRDADHGHHTDDQADKTDHAAVRDGLGRGLDVREAREQKEPNNTSHDERTREDGRGARWMTNGLTIYYMPLAMLVDNVTHSTFFANIALFRTICWASASRSCTATSVLMHERGRRDARQGLQKPNLRHLPIPAQVLLVTATMPQEVLDLAV